MLLMHADGDCEDYGLYEDDSEDESVAIGRGLRHLRRERGLSLAAMGALLEIDPSAI